jgi:outer membrane murein-binding lipoprotein Lpp
MKSLVLCAALLSVPFLSGCTVLAIADAAGSAVVYGVKTTVNVLDAITPDIVNKKK